jgi:hypothetical protein
MLEFTPASKSNYLFGLMGVHTFYRETETILKHIFQTITNLSSIDQKFTFIYNSTVIPLGFFL